MYLQHPDYCNNIDYEKTQFYNLPHRVAPKPRMATTTSAQVITLKTNRQLLLNPSEFSGSSKIYACGRNRPQVPDNASSVSFSDKSYCNLRAKAFHHWPICSYQRKGVDFVAQRELGNGHSDFSLWKRHREEKTSSILSIATTLSFQFQIFH